MAILQVRQLKKNFNQEMVLRGIDLSIDAGSVTSIIGRSGSGKSTLLRCLNQLERPDSGEIVFDGQNVFPQSNHLTTLRKNIGMVFQAFHLFPHKTVLENIIEAPMIVLKQTKDEAIQSAYQLLQQVGLSEKASEYPVTLSGGQKQRVAIARSLAMKPKVLLFDEPTSALDPESVEGVLKVMKDLAASGMTMIIVTHEFAFAKLVSDHVVFIEGGIVIEQGPPQVIFSQPKEAATEVFIQSLSTKDL